MIAFAKRLHTHSEELALLETLDMGKPISDSLNIDLPGSVDALSWSGEAIDKIYDEVAPTPEDQLGLVTREPGGHRALEFHAHDGSLEAGAIIGYR